MVSTDGLDMHQPKRPDNHCYLWRHQICRGVDSPFPKTPQGHEDAKYPALANSFFFLRVDILRCPLENGPLGHGTSKGKQIPTGDENRTHNTHKPELRGRGGVLCFYCCGEVRKIQTSRCVWVHKVLSVLVASLQDGRQQDAHDEVDDAQRADGHEPKHHRHEEVCIGAFGPAPLGAAMWPAMWLWVKHAYPKWNRLKSAVPYPCGHECQAICF